MNTKRRQLWRRVIDAEKDMTTLLSKREVAARLGFHPEHIMRMARQGKFPRPMKSGSATNCAVRFREVDIEGWITSRMAALDTTEPAA
jgi:predicted DNA-binding transcriptional regulator AlpA